MEYEGIVVEQSQKEDSFHLRMLFNKFEQPYGKQPCEQWMQIGLCQRGLYLKK